MSSPRFPRKRWRNPERIRRTELTTRTRDFIARVEEASGFKCRRIREVRNEDGTDHIVAEFSSKEARKRRPIPILHWHPDKGYSLVSY